MIEETTLEIELSKIVYNSVEKEKYPSPIQLIDDSIYRKQLEDLKQNRPSTKTKYLSQLELINKQISNISTQNNQNNINYYKSVKEIDDKYINDIAIAKLDEANIWKAIRSYRNYLLSQCDWTDTVSAQTRLSDTEKEQWNKYRQELRDITKSFSSPKDVIFPTINMEV